MCDSYTETIYIDNETGNVLKRIGQNLVIVFAEECEDLIVSTLIGYVFIISAYIRDHYILITLQGRVQINGRPYDENGFKEIIIKVSRNNIRSTVISGTVLGSTRLELQGGTPFVYGNFLNCLKLEDESVDTPGCSFFILKLDEELRKVKLYTSLAGISACKIFPTNNGGAEIISTTLVDGVSAGTVYVLAGDKLTMKLMTSGSQTEFNSAHSSGLISGVSSSEFSVGDCIIKGGTFVLKVYDDYQVKIHAHTEMRVVSKLKTEKSIFLLSDLYDIVDGSFVKTGSKLPSISWLSV